MFGRAVASSFPLLVKPSVVTLFREMLKAVYKHILSINKRVLLSNSLLLQHYSIVQTILYHVTENPFLIYKCISTAPNCNCIHMFHKC